MKTKLYSACYLTAAWLIVPGPTLAADMGTAFTFQGRLENGIPPVPVTDTCDFRFGLWDAAAGGNQKGNSPQTLLGVGVDAGLFTVAIDFGAAAIDGTARWMEMEVKCPLNPGFILLSPRVELTPAPHALALPGLYTQQNATSPNVIGGYSGNTVGPGTVGATIGGGGASGLTNGVGADYATVGGGNTNNATGRLSTVGGGYNNSAGGVCVGGPNLGTSCQYNSDCPSSACSTHDDPSFATVGGGEYNSATGWTSTVGGGLANAATGDWSTVGGGKSNTASGGSTVGGGQLNDATGDSSTIGGGFLNSATGQRSTVGGGQNNYTADEWWSTIGGGVANVATGESSTVGGGQLNVVGKVCAGGPYFGRFCQSDSDCTSSTCSPDPANHATVGGGSFNTASAAYATIAGGGPSDPDPLHGNQFTTNNHVTDAYGTIGGGGNNRAGDSAGTTTDRTYATVAGGQSNTASGAQSTIGGGQSNNATGIRSVVGGGFSNTASGGYSTVTGGNSNLAGGDHSFAAGFHAKVRDAAASGDANGDEGTFVWADQTLSDFTSTGPNQFLVRASGGTRIYSNGTLTAGVTLAAGGGSWVSVSDRNAKANLSLVDARDVLERLAAIPIGTWNLQSQDASIRHIGPMAQDFHSAFGVGDDERGINTVDADGVALAAIQGLYEIVQDKDCRIEELQAETESLREASAALATRLAAIETLIARSTNSVKDGGR